MAAHEHCTDTVMRQPGVENADETGALPHLIGSPVQGEVARALAHESVGLPPFATPQSAAPTAPLTQGSQGGRGAFPLAEREGKVSPSGDG